MNSQVLDVLAFSEDSGQTLIVIIPQGKNAGRWRNGCPKRSRTPQIDGSIAPEKPLQIASRLPGKVDRPLRLQAVESAFFSEFLYPIIRALR